MPAYFRCSLCEFSCFVTVERERLNEPTDCGNPNCEARNTMEVIHNRSRYTDKQIAKLQETPGWSAFPGQVTKSEKMSFLMVKLLIPLSFVYMMIWSMSQNLVIGLM